MRTITFVAIIVSALAASWSRAQEGPAAAGQATGYAWADACKTCHQPIYDAWARTKHAKSLDRLSANEQQQECVGCHVTGPKVPIRQGAKTLNAGVQCESCHGAAAAHAADPSVRAGLAKKPVSEVCERCHNEKSPRFKGFYYAAMAAIVHTTR